MAAQKQRNTAKGTRKDAEKLLRNTFFQLSEEGKLKQKLRCCSGWKTGGILIAADTRTIQIKSFFPSIAEGEV